ncbi:FAD/NAD(P) binding domain-containing protein [Devosia pacifica]|uniref:FAD/NAD(P) binding domain-containing protein n=1 Tax=Devosia pacifica TaxID=1335967 RepID=A0A918SD13_9HYPH|nr:FAD/NAD(P)-binding protein [Devosia pacifica]GHA34916.1 FAD/NAD(P) binding domain-containing protein [Devosia pacifica]
MTKKKRVALVGGGPTAVYTLKNLLQKAEALHITIFEAGRVAGCGLPYSEDHNTPDLMANITSVEIPPVLVSLSDWVRSADGKLLKKFGIARDQVNERDFYPRVLIGAYYSEQLARLAEACAPWQTVTIETETRVVDVSPAGQGFTLRIDKNGKKARRHYDAVIMATGHLTKGQNAQPLPGLFRSPYPVQNLEVGSDRAALILGSSLSAIDAAVGLANRYGKFVGDENHLSFELLSKEPLRLVMASRKGTLPDADFFYPIPEEPLMIFTPARLQMLRQEGQSGLLGRAFKLFKKQLAADDPDFVARLALQRFTPEGFAKAYLAMRKARQGFDAIEQNLAEATRDYRERRVVMWRYTMMRAHEVFSELVPFLDRRDLARFRRHLAPVFADAYGCVPHLSILRLLALQRAGCLDIVALGEDGTIRYGAGNFILAAGGREESFGTFIDARGQQAASFSELGFSQLDQALATTDPLKRTNGQRNDDQFRLRLDGQPHADIFCISIPVMMERYPFAQGLVACSEAAEVVATAI